MPSGIITIKDVPTRTPMPIEEINRSWEGERVKARGNEPTIKDLRRGQKVLVCIGSLLWCFSIGISHVAAITMLRASKVKSPSMVASCRKSFARVPGL